MRQRLNLEWVQILLTIIFAYSYIADFIWIYTAKKPYVRIMYVHRNWLVIVRTRNSKKSYEGFAESVASDCGGPDMPTTSETLVR
jgi:hypothetical protein